MDMELKPTLWKTLISLLAGLSSTIIVYLDFHKRFYYQNSLNWGYSEILFGPERYFTRMIVGLIFYFILIYLIWSYFQEMCKDERPISKLAIISFSCSFLAISPFRDLLPYVYLVPGLSVLSKIILFPLFALGGLVSGAISLWQIKKYNLRGEKLAIFSLVISSLALIFAMYLLANPPGPIF